MLLSLECQAVFFVQLEDLFSVMLRMLALLTGLLIYYQYGIP
jgi:hypothetical protein